MESNKLDVLVNVAFINFFTLGKDEPHILLNGIDINDKRHLACIHIAKLVSDMYGFNFYTDKNIIDHWKLSRKCKSKKWLKRINRKNMKSINKLIPVDIEDFVSHIENANDIMDGFAEVYDEYYKE